MEAILGLIRSQVGDLMGSVEFKKWMKGEKVGPNDWVILNNSFMYREAKRIKTNKSSLYLGLRADSAGHLSSSNLHVVRYAGSLQNCDFKRVASGGTELADAARLDHGVTQQLSQLGSLVFVLIADIRDDLILRKPIECGPFQELVLNPQSIRPVTIDGSSLVVSYSSEPESLWEKINELAQECRAICGPLGENERKSFAAAINEVFEAEYAHLVIPTPGTGSDDTLLDRIANAIGEETDDYRDSLSKWTNEPGLTPEFNNVLRIAYNFVSEADALIALLMSVCDLKPIVLWTTIHHHWRLRRAFETLPWAQLGGKPSMSSYESSIKGARNRAFHHLLPVPKTLVADLQGVPMRARTLKLFSVYSRAKTGNQLDYEDRELVEVLTRFTRAEEKVVGADFWDRNEEVMRATSDLALATARTLKMLHARVAV